MTYVNNQAYNFAFIQTPQLSKIDIVFLIFE